MRLALPFLILVGCTYDDVAISEPYLTGSLSVDRAAEVLADGSDAAEIRVRVFDSRKVPRPRAVVRFSYDEGEAGSTLTPPQATGPDGTTSAYVAAGTPGLRRLRAVIVTGVEEVPIPGVVSVEFVTSRDDTARFRPAEIHVSNAPPTAIARADVDWDGVVDIVTVSSTAAVVSYYRGTPGGLTVPPDVTDVGELPRALAIGNIDHESGDEVVVVHPSKDALTVLRPVATHLEVRKTLAACGRPRDVALLSLDGEPLDVAVACANEARLGLALDTSNQDVFSPFTFVDTGLVPIALASGALDAARTPGLAVANQSSATVGVYGLKDGELTLVATVPVAPFPLDVVLTDLDDDGDADLVVLSGDDGAVTVYLQDPTNLTFSAGEPLAVGSVPTTVVAGYVGTDSHADLVVTSRSSARVLVFLGDGTGDFTAGPVLNPGAVPTGAVVGDFDADGRPDIAAISEEAATLSVFYGK